MPTADEYISMLFRIYLVEEWESGRERDSDQTVLESGNQSYPKWSEFGVSNILSFSIVKRLWNRIGVEFRACALSDVLHSGFIRQIISV